MLRYIYLLCFIITINLELVFCYNYISENHRRPERLRRGARVAKRRDSGVEERPLLQQLDVADFLLSPAEAEGYSRLSPDEGEGYGRLSPDEAEGYSRLEPDELYSSRQSYQPPEKRGRRRDAPYPADWAEPRPAGLSRYQHSQLSSRHLLNKNKKYALTKMFPFFSHNKSSNAQPKKAKSKTSLGKSAKKAKMPSIDSMTMDLHKEQKSQGKGSIDELHVEKRYAAQICPKCKMKFLQLKKRWQPKVIHNSRQYFASNPVKEVETSSKQFKNNNVKKRLNVDEVSELWRKKRRVLRN